MTVGSCEYNVSSLLCYLPMYGCSRLIVERFCLCGIFEETHENMKMISRQIRSRATTS